MAARVRILFVDRAREHLDGPHNEGTVFLGGALEVGDELLQFLRHDVEGLSQFADFGAAGEFNATGEIGASNSTAGFGENLEGIGDALGGEDTDADAEE